MKKLIAVVALLLLGASSIHAADISQNPDKTASIGLGITAGTLYGSGTSTEYLTDSALRNIPFETGTQNEVDLFVISPSFRVPVHNKLTVELGYDHIIQKYSYTGELTKFKGKVSGDAVRIHLRYFLDK